MNIMNIDGINVVVTRKRIKNMYLRILPPDGAVHVSAPLGASNAQLTEFVRSRKDWINKHVGIIREREAAKPLPNEYLDGETVELLGKRVALRTIDCDKKQKAVMEDNAIVLYVKADATFQTRAALMRAFYTDVLRSILPELISKDEETVGEHALEWRFREMKTRWGVCNVQKRRITLNTRLAMRPKECIDYVVVHELTHFIEKSHSAVFKAYLDKFCPDWRRLRKLLNDK